MYFRQIFENILNEYAKGLNLKESPIVKFIATLAKEKKFNKYIKIPSILTDYDNDFVMIENNGKLFTWHIADRVSQKEIERSKDQFSTLEKCLQDLTKLLKDQTILDKY